MAAAPDDDIGNKRRRRRSFRWWPIWIAVGVGVVIAVAIAAGTMQFLQVSPQDDEFGETETARDIEPGIQEGPGLADRPLVGDQLEDEPEFENQTNSTVR